MAVITQFRVAFLSLCIFSTKKAEQYNYYHVGIRDLVSQDVVIILETIRNLYNEKW
jgi:hypothetical protein